MNRRHFGQMVGGCMIGFATVSRVWAAIRMAGRIIGIRGEGSAEVRRGGDVLSASEGLLLYSGDTVVASGSAEVIAVVYGEMRIFSSDEASNVIVERPNEAIDPDDEKYFASFESFAAETPAAMPAYRHSREATKADYRVKPSPLLPPGRQLIPEGTRSASLVWQDGSSLVRITPDFGNPVEMGSGTSSWITLNIPPHTDRLRVELVDHPVQWTLIMASKAEIEKAGGGRSIRLGHAARLRWAHETLLSRPPQFNDIRVAALSIIAEEAKRTDVNSEFAKLVWLAARNGRLERQLQYSELSAGARG